MLTKMKRKKDILTRIERGLRRLQLQYYYGKVHPRIERRIAIIGDRLDDYTLEHMYARDS